MDDPFGALAGYDHGSWPLAGPTWSRLRSSIYPLLDICVDSYYASISRNYRGNLELQQHIEAMQQFLAEGADVSVRDEATGCCCLHFAAGSGSEEMCALLLQARARPAARDKKLRTPLFWAIAGEHLAVCQLLLRREPGLATLAAGQSMTPLHSASRVGNPHILALLLPFYRSGPDLRGPALRTPLHFAAGKGHLQAVMLLVAASADPQLPCSSGRTALHYAAEWGGRGDSLELCHFLLSRKPKGRQVRDASGRRPLEVAAAHGGRVAPEMKSLFQPRPRRRVTGSPRTRMQIEYDYWNG